MDKCFSASEVYNPAIHFKDTEILQKTGQNVDVQATIEEPNIYILGPSHSTIENQTQFTPTNQEDL